MHVLRVGCALNWTPNTIHTPISSTNILSRPTGPNELFTMLAMEQAAITGTKKKRCTMKKVYISLCFCALGAIKYHKTLCHIIALLVLHIQVFLGSNLSSETA